MGTWAIVLCTIMIVGSFLFSVLSVVAGKVKLRRAVQPIEYYPPRGFSPVDVLIMHRGHRATLHDIFNPLVLYWADRGFIEIEEDCKRGLKLTKLKELCPPEKKPNKVIQLVKGDYNAEKELFDSIFSYGKVFYTLAAVGEYKDDYSKFLKACKKNAKSTKTKLSRKLTFATIAVSFAVSLMTALTVGLSYGGAMYLAMIFPLVAIPAFCSVPSDETIGVVIKYPFFLVWGGAPLAVVLAFTPFVGSMLLCAALLSSLLTVGVLVFRIDIRDDDSVELYGRICAFKRFLLDAETDRLETLIEEDPDYYYNILPYCYVLKLTKKLKPKFDRITMDGVSWYLGNLRDTLMF